MTIQAEHHCWRIRKGVARAFFLLLIPYAAWIVVWFAGVWDNERAFERYFLLILPAAAFPLFGFAYCQGLATCIKLSREGLTFEYPLHRESFPLSAIKDVHFSSYRWPFGRDHMRASISIARKRVGLLVPQRLFAVRESWYDCEPGEVERAFRAYCPDAIDADKMSLSEVAGVSSEGMAAATALPDGFSVRQRFNSLARWLWRGIVLILVAICACMGCVAFWLIDPELPAHSVGTVVGWFSAVFFFWALCWREVLEIDISPKGIALRFLSGWKFYSREAIQHVCLSVYMYRSGRPPMVSVFLRIRRRLFPVRVTATERLGSDVIKALTANFADVCEVNDTMYRRHKHLYGGKEASIAVGDRTA